MRHLAAAAALVVGLGLLCAYSVEAQSDPTSALGGSTVLGLGIDSVEAMATVDSNNVDSSAIGSVVPEHRGNPGLERETVCALPIRYGRLALVGGTLTGTMIAIHIYQQNGWWKDNRAAFHFQEDLNYGLWVDKIGHFYGASVEAFIATKAFRWADVPEGPALWLGSGTSLLFQSYIEIQDGFSAWGFDRVDFAFDVAGAAWPLAQHYVPPLRNVDLKLSYHPSPLLNNPGGVGFQGQQHLVMDDYEGQTFWLSVKMNNILPPNIESIWPDFLCLAVGYGARDITGQPYSVQYIGLDLDMTKVIPDDTWFLKTLGQALNFIRLPLPAVRIYPDVVWYGLYF